MKNLLTALLLFLFSTATGEAYKSVEDQATIPVLTPSLARQTTAKLILPNGLQAYLISDPDAKKSGAALTVEAGGWHDPVQHPGLAHFLEHMLFLGTKKYPKESEYERFITTHGGQTNAYTSFTSSAFLFTVNHSAFPEALDRFSHFFTEPLFNPSGVEREVKAIDQEYAKNLDNDSIRHLFVHKELATSGHPHQRFYMGNKKSLANAGRDDLQKWFDQHYSANKMHLVIYSSLPIDRLKELAAQDFSSIPDRKAPAHTFPSPASDVKYRRHYVYIEPVKNERSMTMIWEFSPRIAKMDKTKPEQIVCHILGHEGEGSLFSLLKQEHLADGLKCGVLELSDTIHQLYLEIDLTERGVHATDQVALRVFQAIASLQKEEMPPRIFDELHRLSKLKYQYRSKDEPFMSLMKHSMLIQKEALATYPENSLMILSHSPAHVQALLKELNPRDVRIDILAPSKITGVQPDKTEQWLGVPYSIHPIPENQIEEWANAQPNPKIGIPPANPYIPEHLSMIETPPAKKDSLYPVPKLILNESYGKAFYAADREYNVPKTSWVFLLRTPEATMKEASKVVLGDLYVKLVKEALNQTIYPAQIADLDFEISREDNGIKITLNGYSEKAPLLLKEIVATMKELKPLEAPFQIAKESLLREYQNFKKEGSLSQCGELMKKVIYKDYVSEKAKEPALKKVDLKTVKAYAETLFEKAYLEAMLYGNLTEQDARELVQTVYDTLDFKPYPPEEQVQKEVIVLPGNKGPFFLEETSKSQGNALVLMTEEPAFSFKTRAAQQVMMQAIKEPFFEALRTKQQTGYIVFSYPQEIEQKLFNFFAVQSNTHSPRDLLARFEQFIEQFVQELGKTELGREQFMAIKKSLLAQLEQPPENMEKMTELLFKFAFEYDENFDWMEKRIKGLQELTYDEQISLTRQQLGRQNRRRLGILWKGLIPEENVFHYTRCLSPKAVRNLGIYQ